MVWAKNITTEQLLEKMDIPEVYVEDLLEYLFEDNSLDVYEAWQLRIQSAFMKFNSTERKKIGHNASIFLHTATFSGNCSYNCETLYVIS